MDIISKETAKAVLTPDEYKLLTDAMALLSKMDFEMSKGGDRKVTEGVSGVEVRSGKRDFTPEHAASAIHRALVEYVYDPYELEEGEYVEVIHPGGSYTTYVEWVDKYLDSYDRVKYDYGYTPPKGAIGKVIKRAPHTKIDLELYCIEINKRYYLIAANAVKRIGTKAEVEAEVEDDE